MTLRRLLKLVDCWFALHLALVVPTVLLFGEVLGQTAAYSLAAAGTLVAAGVIVFRTPDVDTRPFWNLGFLILGCSILLGGLLAVSNADPPTETFGLAFLAALAYWIPTYYRTHVADSGGYLPRAE